MLDTEDMPIIIALDVSCQLTFPSLRLALPL